MNRKKAKMSVLGAGGVGLGFLAPELQEHYDISFIDVSANADVIRRIRRTRRFSINIAGPSVEVVNVGGVTAFNSDDAAQRKQAVRRLAEADMIFTATGAKFLSSIAPIIRDALLEMEKVRRTRPVAVCCCENGKEIAAKLKRFVFDGIRRSRFSFVRFSDTVIARMCKVEDCGDARRELRENGMDHVARQIVPLWTDFGRAVIVEPYYGIVVEARAVKGIDFPASAVNAVPPKVFKAMDDQKTYIHNGGHGLLSYLGYLRGYRFFHQLRDDREIYGAAFRAAKEEVGVALVREHPSVLTRYGMNDMVADIFRRMTCPYFNDNIERGVRGSLAKLGPDERFIGGARLCVRHGIEPEALCMGIAAGIVMNFGKDVPPSKLQRILRETCGLDPKQERVLCNAIRRALRSDFIRRSRIPRPQG